MNAPLPEGLRVGAKLSSGATCGEVFELEDDRLGADLTIKRTIRILPSPRDEIGDCGAPSHRDWRRSFRERLRALGRQSLPYVSAPSEHGRLSDGREYIIGDHDGVSLDARIPTQEGLDSSVVLKSFHELLTGLAGLHERGLVHGDVRPGNVFLRESGPGRFQVRLGDAAIGPLAYWSAGQLVDGQALRYLPPDWNGQIQAPEPRADLYALGLVTCEMLLGKGPCSELIAGQERLDDRVGAALSHAPWRLRRMLPRLLAAAPRRRPNDAVEALDEWVRLGRTEAQRPLRCALFLLVAVGLVLGWSTWSGRQALDRSQEFLRETERQRQQADNERRNLTVQLDTAQNSLQAVQRQLDKMEREKLDFVRYVELAEKTILARGGQPPPRPRCVPASSPDSSLGKAQQLWRQNLKLADEEIKRQILEEPDEAVRKLALGWFQTTSKLRDQGLRWRGDSRWEANLRPLLRAAAQEPWDDAAVRQAESRIQSYSNAERAWRGWAYDERRRWDDLTTLIDDPKKYDADTQAILKGWHNDLLSHSQDWTLRLNVGVAPAGYGTTREVGVKGNSGWTYTPPHDWSDAEKQTYGSQPDVPRDITFSWEPGTPLGVCMYGERSTWKLGLRSHLLEEEIGGPLALWRLHDQGRVEQNGFSIAFDIEKCPGPPRGDSLIDMAKEIVDAPLVPPEPK